MGGFTKGTEAKYKGKENLLKKKCLSMTELKKNTQSLHNRYTFIYTHIFVNHCLFTLWVYFYIFIYTPVDIMLSGVQNQILTLMFNVM